MEIVEVKIKLNINMILKDDCIFIIEGPLLVNKTGFLEIAAISAGRFVNKKFVGFYPMVSTSLDWILGNSYAKDCQKHLPSKA